MTSPIACQVCSQEISTEVSRRTTPRGEWITYQCSGANCLESTERFFAPGAEPALSTPPPPTTAQPIHDAMPPPPSSVPDEDLPEVVKCAHAYSQACAHVMLTGDDVLASANKILWAKSAIEENFGNQIALENLNRTSNQEQPRFRTAYQAFLFSYYAAKDAGSALLDAAKVDGQDPEMLLVMILAEDSYSTVSAVGHMLRTFYPGSPESFVEALNESNERITEDIFFPGDKRFVGCIASTEPLPLGDIYCPWCAELIKAAAIVCRFCNRDLNKDDDPSQD